MFPMACQHFGHSRDFSRKRSKFPGNTWGTFRRNLPSVPKPDSQLQNPRGTNLHFNAPVPKTRKSVGNNSVKSAPVPKPAHTGSGAAPPARESAQTGSRRPGNRPTDPGISPPVHVTPGHPPNHLLRKRFLPVRLRKIPPQICLTFSPSSSALKTDSTG